MELESKYKNLSLTQFLEKIDREHFSWIIKRLSGNDTGITGGHQSGIYVPKTFMNAVVPAVATTEIYNPTKEIACYIPSHDCFLAGIQAKYYNNKYFPERNLKKKYNEFRLTRWKGTPLQDIENTGSICILAGKFDGNNSVLLAWVSCSIAEEDLIENWFGQEIEPGEIYGSSLPKRAGTTNIFDRIPETWFSQFPSGHEIFEFVENEIPQNAWTKTIDELLLKRRKLEFEVFSEMERRDVLPNVKNGFASVDEFFKYANSVANRRKARAGMSLEFHLESIFNYERLDFETQVITEQNKRPDFVFPSGEAYRNPAFPSAKLHMLAAKTCCKDRWRQVINEANRISPKHLFTLQEGVSANQLDEMHENGIILVVPQPILKSFPENHQNEIMTLTGFVEHIRESQNSI